MKVLYQIYRVLRSIIVSVVLSAVGLFSVFYLLLIMPGVQDSVRKVGESELTKLLHVPVSIGQVSIKPFNRVSLEDVMVADEKGDTILKVGELGAGMSIYNLITKRRLVFTYAEIIDIDGRIWRDSVGAPLNIQPIIDALSKKDDKKEPAKFDVKIHNAVIRRGRVSYDVLDKPIISDRFDANHIGVENFTADIYFPKIRNNDFEVNVKRLALREKSGFRLDKLSADVVVNDTLAALRRFRMELPNSLICPEDIELRYSSLANIKSEIKTLPIRLRFPNCYVGMNDFACFNPMLSRFEEPLVFSFAVEGSLNDLHIPVLKLGKEDDSLGISISGNVSGLPDNDLHYSFPHFDVSATSSEIVNLANCFSPLKEKVAGIIENCKAIHLNGSASGSATAAKYVGTVSTSVGNLAIDASAHFNKESKRNTFSGALSTGNFNLGTLLGNNDLGALALAMNVDVALAGKKLDGTFNSDLNYFDYKGYRYNNISADISLDRNHCEGKLFVGDENVEIIADGALDLAAENTSLDLEVDVAKVDFSKIYLWKKFPDKVLSFNASAKLVGNNPDNITGNIALERLHFDSLPGTENLLDSFTLTVADEEQGKLVRLNSDLINGTIEGKYTLRTIAGEFNNIFYKIFPSLFAAAPQQVEDWNNDFMFDFTINPDNRILDLFKSPIRIADRMTLVGAVNTSTQSCWANLDVPYLVQNNKKVIEASSLRLTVDGAQNACSLSARTKMPNKKGLMLVTADITGVNDRIDTDFGWNISNAHNYSGNVNLSTLISRDEESNIAATVDVNPSRVYINDTLWCVNPAKIEYSGKRITVDDLQVLCDKQFVKIDGIVSDNPDEIINVALRDIDLDYIFETLAINNVTFGGRATGDFSASNLLSKTPSIQTPGLAVSGMKYNGALLGDAIIQSEWLNDTKGISLNADISQPNGSMSYVRGAIYPLADSLYLDFDCNHLDVRFLQPFMAAFTSKIGGSASGHGTLYGNFKRINFFGRIKPEDFKIKIDYLNTEYTTNDSIIILPGDIALKDVTIRDKNGKTAQLNGHIRHEDFHNAEFDLAITQASELLCFDTDETIEPIWYGTIYGNGSAFIKGEPGILNIDVNMSTAPSSKFTFVLSDSKAASDYNFITITDRNAKPVEVDTVPEIIRRVRAKVDDNKSTPTIFNLNLNVEATTQAQMILVMDPVAGDRIRANGSGTLHLSYNSADDDIRMNGKYTLDKGDYNFTLQDIIIKDFTILKDSFIQFDDDPLDAELGISAVYAVNANLTDLDESFAQDKDMNRTNVPVQAVLNVTGKMTNPEVNFDLNFPTLTQDAIRKVKSIVNTQDMMNRQIIYLLALSRFYTPEYTGAQSQNNELTSVASSTISSQLANILGQVSENLSIAPNFRSNKGDFSDIEVDVALSSQLLNNRLLINGNLGYRDKSLNANGSTFIGDFDIEYLLTKTGNIRLKAYNHYNDQNYYIKSALTTQGVGVMFKHDFNRFFDFLKPKKKSVPSDTVPVSTLLRREEVVE
ncbi:MAG: translocation/assembly module TamB [Bacteroidales bacterium]|nr:translocation/assembly module TamB [Bacteroidales bacterium]